MAGSQALKQQLKALLASENWREAQAPPDILPGMVPGGLPGVLPDSMSGMVPGMVPGGLQDGLPGSLPNRLPGGPPNRLSDWLLDWSRPGKLVGPLAAFFSRGGLAASRAAVLFAQAVNLLAAANLEDGRGVMRRLMWQMNEDSGNLGWGVPEAMAEVMARNAALAAEYSKILLSYIIDTGNADNYVDYAPLRAACYLAAGLLGAARPAFASRALPRLAQGLAEQEAFLQGAALWAMRELAANLTKEEKAFALKALADFTLAGPAPAEAARPPRVPEDGAARFESGMAGLESGMAGLESGMAGLEGGANEHKGNAAEKELVFYARGEELRFTLKALRDAAAAAFRE